MQNGIVFGGGASAHVCVCVSVNVCVCSFANILMDNNNDDYDVDGNEVKCCKYFCENYKLTNL